MKKVKRKTVFQTVHYIVLENYHIQENVYFVTRLWWHIAANQTKTKIKNNIKEN